MWSKQFRHKRNFNSLCRSRIISQNSISLCCLKKLLCIVSRIHVYSTVYSSWSRYQAVVFFNSLQCFFLIVALNEEPVTTEWSAAIDTGWTYTLPPFWRCDASLGRMIDYLYDNSKPAVSKLITPLLGLTAYFSSKYMILIDIANVHMLDSGAT